VKKRAPYRLYGDSQLNDVNGGYPPGLVLSITSLGLANIFSLVLRSDVASLCLNEQAQAAEQAANAEVCGDVGVVGRGGGVAQFGVDKELAVLVAADAHGVVDIGGSEQWFRVGIARQVLLQQPAEVARLKSQTRVENLAEEGHVGALDLDRVHVECVAVVVDGVDARAAHDGSFDRQRQTSRVAQEREHVREKGHRARTHLELGGEHRRIERDDLSHLSNLGDGERGAVQVAKGVVAPGLGPVGADRAPRLTRQKPTPEKVPRVTGRMISMGNLPRMIPMNHLPSL